jgi:uncharacterized 2Fe-2S/4Fe-4S cluster protein (DUF4445 family)
MNDTHTAWIQTISLTPPTLQDNTADTDRLLNALKARLNTDALHIDLDLIKKLTHMLRESNYSVCCIVFKDRHRWVRVDVTAANDARVIAGLAIDLGTTRVVLRLLDLRNGRTINESAFDNPQESIGPDILARIHFAAQPEGLEKLNALIIDGLNAAILNLCKDNQLEPQNIYALSVAGMLDVRGRFVPAICGSRLKEIDGMLHLVVVSADQAATNADLTISQADVDSLIRSKAAMYTILETITASVGISFEKLETFYVAGTFGSFINPRSAISIGMLPDLPLERYKPLGNSCLGGAALALTSDKYLDEIDDIRNRITYLELNVNQEFMNRFSAARFLPHTDPTRFPSVKPLR